MSTYPQTSFSTKEIINFYFPTTKNLSASRTSSVIEFKCLWGRERKQNLGSGFSNLLNHVKSDHPEYNNEMNKKFKDGNTSMIFSKKTWNVYSWLQWIIEGGHPFSFVESKSTRKYPTLEPISVDTFVSYMQKLTSHVEEKIRNILPPKIGLVLDGWAHQSVHYLGIFAVFNKSGQQKKLLLSLAPLLDEQSLTVDSHIESIQDVLQIYNKDSDLIIYISGDNCNLNKSIC